MNKPLYIKKTKGRGRGVYCTAALQKDEIIERCPILVLPGRDFEIATSSRLSDYFFYFNKEDRSLALVWGFGSLYNHAVHANAAYHLDRENRTMCYYAIRDIPPNTEILINYAGETGHEYKEWFLSRNIPFMP